MKKTKLVPVRETNTSKNNIELMSEGDFNALNKASEVGGIISDDENPIFLLSLASNELLALVVAGKVDLKFLAALMLKNRGYAADGFTWIGFRN